MEGMTVYRFGRLGTIATIALLIMGAGSSEANETVRVRLFSGKQIESASLSEGTGGGLTIYDSSGPLATLDNGQVLTFDIWNEFLRAQWTSGNVPLERAFVRSDNGEIKVTVNDETRTYRGSIELVLDGDIERPSLLIINEVALPDYISSVLPSEYGFTEPEGMKAQAIVIRTYALRARSQRQGPYDLTDDTGSQVYMGVSSENDGARAAVKATTGMAITYKGELIEAVYSAHCGGHSANNEDVWMSKAVPYLRGRDDPYDHDAPVAHWESRINKKDLLDLLSRLYSVKVKDISIADRGAGKHVTAVRLKAKGDDLDITAQSFRVAVNNRFGSASVKSTLFDFNKDGDSYHFTGKGLGHGVGLCQWGAAEQAREGRSYKDILHFYYQDVKIEGYESEPPVAAAALANPARVEKSTRDEPPATEKKQKPAKKEPQVKKAAKAKKDAHPAAVSPKLTGRRVGW